MTKHHLQIDSIRKIFDKKQILADVFLRCETGQIIGLLGRNGCGKSTLLQIIAGVCSAEQKFVTIDDVKISSQQKNFRSIAYLPQHSFIPHHLSVKKVIVLSVPKELHSDFYDSEIKKIADREISELSGGELRYLEIKLVLIGNSKFVLLDEPYNGLSPIIIERINQIIVEASLTKGIILTDHNYEVVQKVSTDLYFLKDGNLSKVKNSLELIEKGYLVR